MHRRTSDALPFNAPFTRADALAAGLSIGALRGLERRGLIARAQRGLYLPTGCTDRLAAGLRLVPARFVVAFEAAAELHGLPLPTPRRLSEVDAYAIDKVERSTSENSFVRLHYVDLPDDQVTVLQGRRVTSLARTALDVTCRASRLTSLVAVDAALRMGVRYDDLWAARHSLNGFRGAAKLNWVIANGNALSESPNESVSRAAILNAGLPAPALQSPVLGEDGITYFADFYWHDRRLIGEADGALKYDEPGSLFREKRREDALRAAGYEVVRWTWSDVYPRPEPLLTKLALALRRPPHRRSS